MMLYRARFVFVFTGLVALLAGLPPAFGQTRSPEQWLEYFSAHWSEEGWGPPPYLRAAEDRGWQARFRTLQGLVMAGEESVQPLLKALRDGDPAQRMLAAQTLGYLAPHVPSEPLLHAIGHDPEAAVRLYAVDALARQGRAGSSRQLTSLQNDEQNRDVKKHIAYALAREAAKIDDQTIRDLKRFDRERIDATQVGKLAPDFRLPALTGGTVQLSDFRGKKPVVLVFIYGDT